MDLETIVESVLAEAESDSIDLRKVTPITGPTGEPKEPPPDPSQFKRDRAKAKRMRGVQAAVDGHHALLQKHNIVPQGKLGSGSRGIAYSLPDGRVLKITADPDEAMASHRIQGRKGQHVARIYQVFRFPDMQIWGIIQERLTPLSDQEKDQFSDAMNLVHSLAGFYKWREGWEATWDECFSKAGEKYDEGDIQRAKMTLANFGVDEMLDELMRRGIKFHDLHEENVMKRGGQYVIADLGVSSVVDGLPPPVLEKTTEPATGSTDVPDEENDQLRRVNDAEDLLLAHRDLLVKNDIRPIKVLGMGSMGVAFQTQDGKVLKVTTDDSEAIASFKIQGKPIPHVVQIYKVFRFPQKLGGQEAYGILQEKLRGMQGREKQVLHWANKTVQGLFDQKVGKAYANGWDNFTQAVARRFNERGRDPDLKANLARAIAIYQKFGLDKMMDGLLAAGIKFYDYHIGNIMLGKDGPTVIDIGVSATVGGAVPPQLESLDEALADRVIVVAAPLQPFAKAQSEFVRGLAGKGKVILLLSRGPLSFDVMREVVKASLPDQEDRVEVFDAGTMDPVQALERAEQGGSKGLRPGVGFELYAVDAESVQAGLDASGVFSGSSVVPRPLDQKLAMDKASLQAVKSGGMKNVMDPHLFSDPNRVQWISSLLQQREMVEHVVALLEKTTEEWGGEAAATKIVEYNHRLLSKYLKQAPVKIGEGANGVVFDIGGNRVLKVTADQEDAQAATNIVGKTLKHVVKIHEVLNLHHPDEPSTPMWGIVAEKLQTMDENDQDALEIDRAVRIFRNFDKMEGERILRLLASGKVDEFFNELRKALAVQKMEELGTVGSAKADKIKQRLLAQVESEVRELWDVMRKYQILDMVKDLNSVGIHFTDYKASNIGKRGNDYVVLDIGHRAAHQEIGEGVLREGAWPIADILHVSSVKSGEKPMPDLPVKEVPVGTVLYHGSTLEHMDPRRFLSTTSSSKAAQQWVDQEHGGGTVLVFKTQRPLRLLDFPPSHDKDRDNAEYWLYNLTGVRESWRLGHARCPDIWEAVDKMGYDGIYMSSIDSGHDELMIFDAPSAIKFVQKAGGDQVHEMGMGGMGGGHMVGLGHRSQASPWSTGKVTEPKDPKELAPDDDEEPSESERLATMVYDVIGGLTGGR